LAGASAVVVLADRVGKRQSLIVGLLFNAACFALLPLTTGAALPMALTGLAVVALTSEFSIVTSIPLLSGLADRSRGLVMALRTALMWGMVILASFVAPRLWNGLGLPAVAATSTVFALVAALLVWRGIARYLSPDPHITNHHLRGVVHACNRLRNRQGAQSGPHESPTLT
jgi:predicted MFS family arabinose efflux permease